MLAPRAHLDVPAISPASAPDAPRSRATRRPAARRINFAALHRKFLKIDKPEPRFVGLLPPPQLGQ